MSEQPVILTTPAQIEGARLCALKGALKLETLGMTRRGRSVYSIVKSEFGFKGNKASVLAQLIAHIAAFNAANGFGAPAREGSTVRGKVGEGRPA